MIMLGAEPAPQSHRDLLINLMETMPAQIELYARIAEIVDTDPERKRTARERYKQYREHGCTLESHTL
jgi:DNA polymerase-3 subunit chi